MAYCSASNILAYSKNLVASQTTFSEDTDPKLSYIEDWLSSGCAAINQALTKNGWAVPVASGTELYNRLSDLNALFGAGRAELSRVNVTVGPGERTRGQIFMSMFWEELNSLVEGELSSIGGEVATNDGEIYIGGISQDDRDSYDDDSDRVKPRFKRNQFKFDESSYPE